MVLWNFELLWINYGIMKKIWYYPENYGTSIYEGENHGRLQKTMELCFIMEKSYGYIPKQFTFLNK